MWESPAQDNFESFLVNPSVIKNFPRTIGDRTRLFLAVLRVNLKPASILGLERNLKTVLLVETATSEIGQR